MTNFIGKKNILIFLLLSSVGIFGAGCSNITNKHYLYSQPNVDYDWGRISGGMIVSFSSTQTESIASAPYILAVQVRLFHETDGSVTLTNIELTDAGGDKTFYMSDEPLIEKFKTGFYNTGTENKDSVVFFRVKNLSPDYVRLRLRLKYKIETAQFVKEVETELYFEKQYEEFRSNKTWDRLMGI